eukprot:5276065-Alexandrium_andersonii.AAC.1
MHRRRASSELAIAEHETLRRYRPRRQGAPLAIAERSPFALQCVAIAVSLCVARVAVRKLQ